MDEYEEQGLDFLEKTGTEFKATFVKHGTHFVDDKETRDIYEITLTRGTRSMSFMFGQSIVESGFMLVNQNTHKEVRYTWFKDLTYNVDRNEGKLKRDITSILGNLGCLMIVMGTAPTPYSVLASITKYDCGSFSDFCGEFGYSEDSIKARGIYKAVQKEYNNLCTLYSEVELETLQDIS